MEILSKTGVAIEDLFGISGLDIYWYGIMIAIGFACAFFMCSFFCKKAGLKSDTPTDLLIIAIIGAIVGARLYYVAFSWNHFYVPGSFIETLKNIADIRSGGLAIYGGIIGGVIGIAIYAKAKKTNLLRLLDTAAAPLALGQAFGRWGNFFNQEAHGALVENPKMQFFPYAVYIDSPRAGEPAGWYQATFFYESLWCLIICAVLVFVFFKRKYNGQSVLAYFSLYGFERGIVEWLRTDQLLIGSVPVSAILSIALCVASVVLLLVLHFKKYTNETVLKEASPIEESAAASNGVSQEIQDNAEYSTASCGGEENNSSEDKTAKICNSEEKCTESAAEDVTEKDNKTEE